jgi:hypothetical protein
MHGNSGSTGSYADDYDIRDINPQPANISEVGLTPPDSALLWPLSLSSAY